MRISQCVRIRIRTRTTWCLQAAAGVPDAGANAETLAEDNRRLEAELREMQSQMQSREASDAISRVQLGSRAQEAEARADEAEEAAEEAARLLTQVEEARVVAVARAEAAEEETEEAEARAKEAARLAARMLTD